MQRQLFLRSGESPAVQIEKRGEEMMMKLQMTENEKSNKSYNI